MVVDLIGLRCTEDFDNVDEEVVAVDDNGDDDDVGGGCFVDVGNFGDDDKNEDCCSS